MSRGDARHRYAPRAIFDITDTAVNQGVVQIDPDTLSIDQVRQYVAGAGALVHGGNVGVQAWSNLTAMAIER